MSDVMTVRTSRFGEVEVDPATVFEFPQGLLGLEDARRWCLLHHEGVVHLDWLQALDDPEIAMLLVDPDELFDDYNLEVGSDDIEPLALSEVQVHDTTPPVVMRVIARPREEDDSFVVNVRAPILFNLHNRRGMQLAVPDGALPAHYRGPVVVSPGSEPPDAA